MTGVRRRTRWVITGVLAIGLLLLAAPVQARDTYTARPSFTLSISGPQGSGSTTVTLPEGAVPTQLRARVRSDFAQPGWIVVSANGRELDRVSSQRGGPVRARLRPSDTRDGSVVLGMSVDLRSEDVCTDVGDAAASLRNVTVEYRLVGDPATTVASYMAPGARTMTVTTSADPTPAEQQAALTMAAVGVKTLGPAAVIRYSADAPPPAVPALDRVVRIEEGGAAPKVVVRDGVLIISGPAATLTGSAQALGSPFLPVADEPIAVQPSASATPDFGQLTQTLADLNLSVTPLSGIGISDLNLPISQTAFGRPISAARLDLRGTVTPALKGEGRINVLWNGQLMDSQPVAGTSAYSAAVSIAEPQMRRSNILTLQMQYEPSDGCRSGVLPARFDLSPQSVVTATAGQSLSGFAMMPQALGQVTPITLAQPVSQTLRQAVDVLAGLQRLSDRTLAVQLLDFDSFVADERPGIAIGVGPQQDGALDAPLRYAPFRVVDGQLQQLSVQVDGDFAALQAYDTGQRKLIVLGGTGDEAVPLMTDLAWRANKQAGGWESLQGDLAVSQDRAEVTFLTQSGLAAQPEKVNESRILDSTWLILAIIALIVALITGILIRAVRARRHG